MKSRGAIGRRGVTDVLAARRVAAAEPHIVPVGARRLVFSAPAAAPVLRPPQPRVFAFVVVVVFDPLVFAFEEGSDAVARMAWD